jgi:salicylate hydroxylase
VEDAGVLSLAINNVTPSRPVSTMLKAYELSRKERAESVPDKAETTRVVLHYPDGPEQQARDDKFRTVAQGGENPDLL